MLLILWLMIVCVSTESKRQLMVLMIDGARWDYVEKMGNDKLYGFRYFKERGVRVEYVQTTFPSLSYPCWTTLSTGLYPENHGIIGNVMHDKEHDQDFNFYNLITTLLPLWWQDVEPIWTTATRAGLKVATMDWSRSDVPVRGVIPLIATGYQDIEYSIHGKLKEAFSLIKKGFDLVMVHYNVLDITGHIYGPNSEQVNYSMMTVGKALETFINHLVNGSFIENIDIIIVSDHGMTLKCNYPGTNIGNTIDIKRDTTKFIIDSPMVLIFAKPGLELHVYNQLRSVPDYIVKLKSEIPDKFHYKHSNRAPDIIVYPKYNKPDSCHSLGGVHDVDPDEPDMRALFLAFGKSFKGEGLVHKPINMVDIYQIYCHILGIKPQPNNGSWDNVKFLMASSQDDPQLLKDYLVKRRAFTLQWDKSFHRNSSGRKQWDKSFHRNSSGRKQWDKSVHRNSTESNSFMLQTRPTIMYIAFSLMYSHIYVSVFI